MAAIFQTTFWTAFSLMKIYIFRLRFHWILFPRVQLPIFQHWFRWWLGTDLGGTPLSEPNMVRSLTHIRVTRPQWVTPQMPNGANKLWHCCAIKVSHIITFMELWTILRFLCIEYRNIGLRCVSQPKMFLLRLMMVLMTALSCHNKDLHRSNDVNKS